MQTYYERVSRLRLDTALKIKGLSQVWDETAKWRMFVRLTAAQRSLFGKEKKTMANPVLPLRIIIWDLDYFIHLVHFYAVIIVYAHAYWLRKDGMYEGEKKINNYV